MLSIKNVTKVYGSVKALDDVSFEVKKGEFVFLMGPSGAGKTTLLKLILREILPEHGQIIFEGADITKINEADVPKLRQMIGVVFQDFKVLPERTVRENVEVALAVAAVPQEKWKNIVDDTLKLVGILPRAEFFPAQLSGGELQRVSLARALVSDPRLILADEPTGNLDWDTADSIMAIFEKIHKDGKTVIMATHNKEIAAKMKKRIINIKGGKVVG